MHSRVPLLLAAVSVVVFTPRAETRMSAADRRAAPTLTSIVTTGFTRDTNGDGLVDTVAARIIVPAAASIQDLEAATNLAARLGYETTALTLPLVVRDSDVKDPASIAAPILVGRENRFTRRLIDTKAIDTSALKPGQGLLAAVTSPLGGGDGVVVVGGDDEGTLAAGVELAARLPRVWGMTGTTLAAAEDQAVGYLRAHAVTATDAGVSSLVVDSDRRGLARMAMRLHVGSAAEAARAVKLFDELEAAHRRGLEPRILDFTNVAATDLEVVAAAQPPRRVTVTRIGLNQ